MRSEIDYAGVHPENKWTILKDQWRFALWAFFTSMGSVMFGFDLGVGQQPAFQQKFGIPYPSQPSGYLLPAVWQSAWIGAMFGSIAVGELIAGGIMNHIGRKYMLMFGTIITTTGIIVLQQSGDWKMWLGGKILNAFGIGMIFTFSPVWIGEIARPELRGFFLCFLDASITFGQFVIALISRGTSEIDGIWSFKSLIVMEYFFTLLVIVVYPFFPESPYYLIKKGRHEEARKSLNRIHGAHDPGFITIEMNRIEKNVQFSDELAKAAHANGPPYLQLFKGTNRRRTLTAMLPVASQQLLGATFTSGYITYFFSLIGITAVFTISSVLFTVNLVSCLVGFALIEVAGRRKMLVPCVTLITLFNLGIGVAGTVPLTNAAAQWAIVIMVFLWQTFYNVSIGVCGFAVASEIGSLPLRSHTQGVIGLTQVFSGWVIIFTIPYIINPDAGDLGGKIGYMFFGLGVLVTILLYFYCPETKGLSYDEIDYLFSTKTSARKFQETIKVYREQRARDESVTQISEKSGGPITETVESGSRDSDV